MYLSRIVVLFFALFGNYVYINCIQCTDENNNPVDWFVLYKLPKIRTNKENALIKKGLAYAFITSKDVNQWTLSEKSINESDSIVGNTLNELYVDNNSNFYLLYNDQPPNGPGDEDKGHNKGVIIANSNGGIWLIHSTPHFPDIESGNYFFPKSGTTYGQSFLCITLNLDNLNTVGQQLQYNEPNIYSENLLKNMINSVPDLKKAAENITVTKSPWYRKTSIKSVGGVEFVSFAKSKNFNKDLYEDFVAPALQEDLYVETWPNGAGDLPSDCSKPFRVYNIKSINMSAANIDFHRTKDHSKWAVAKNNGKNFWICIGDINRMEHQKNRGGGTVCLNNNILSEKYQELIDSVEQCSSFS